MQLLKQLYLINSKSGREEEIKRFVLTQLDGLDLSIEEDAIGNLFIVKGKTKVYPCVAAHLDEVHRPQKRILHEEDGVIFATDEEGKCVGIGADDKNGVWIALNLLRTEITLKVVLFVQEEKDGDFEGCRGSKACDLAFFEDVKYVIQCDRKGNSDIVTYSKKVDLRLCDDGFIPLKLRQQYGYIPVAGGTTDVVALKRRGLAVPCCNISCGYYNAHKPEECCVIDQLRNCLEFVRSVIKNDCLESL